MVVASSVEAATGATANEVGLALSLLLPNIISRPLGLGMAAVEFNAQMAEVERTLRSSTDSSSTTGSSSSSIGVLWESNIPSRHW